MTGIWVQQRLVFQWSGRNTHELRIPGKAKPVGHYGRKRMGKKFMGMIRCRNGKWERTAILGFEQGQERGCLAGIKEWDHD